MATAVAFVINACLCEFAAAQQTAPPPPPSPSAVGDVFRSPKATDTPGVDSPVIYRWFFNYHHNLSDWIDSKATANPSEGKKLLEDAAKLHQIQESEYPTVAAIAHSVVTDLKRVDREAKHYQRTAKSRGILVDSGVLQQYESQRERVMTGAIRRLQSSLSPRSWQALRLYLNSEIRTHIHAVAAKKL